MLNINQDISALDRAARGNLYRQARDLRLAMQKKVDDVEAFEKRCKESLIAELPVNEGFVTDGYAFVVTTKAKPIIEDWEKVCKYAVEHDRFDFFQKRLADKAVTDTPDWNTLPGIGKFNHKDLSVTKR